MELPPINKLLIYEDEHILVVNKPAGLAVLPDGWEPDAPYLLKVLQEANPGLLVAHRLDKITSGVMVFARNPDAHRELNRQFEKHTAGKVYHALCTGKPDWNERIARHKLRINVGHSHRTMVDNGRGKPAETLFRVLERLAHNALLEAVPATGRTHQIRVHAYALGYPLLGDILYSAPPTGLIERPALHAWSLSFSHPASGERLTFNVTYPRDFERALEKSRAGQ